MPTKTKPWFLLDPLEIAILLTLIVLAAATAVTDNSFQQNLLFWGQGLWSLLSFMTQMALILVGGFMVAISNPVQKVLARLASLPQSDAQAYGLCLLVSAFACWCNWGLGLVVGAFVTMELYRERPTLHFPLLVSTSYMGFVFWHGGLSGSIPLTVSTPGNFSQDFVGDLIPLNQTIFSSFNFSLIATLLLSFIVLVLWLSRRTSAVLPSPRQSIDEPVVDSHLAQTGSTAETAVFSLVMLWSLKLLIIGFLLLESWQGTFRLGLNQVNLILILLALALHHDLASFMNAATKACSKLAPIVVQYPLYGGIMGVMVKSGLAVMVSDVFVDWSNQNTFAPLMFLSAGLVNLFVPSGGGQWAVQAAIVINGAKELQVPLEKVVMAVAWGDAWTNLAQPFWALPLLSIVGLGLKDIIGYCLMGLCVSGSVIGLFFYFF